jgi:DNA mismatch repair protein MutS2
VNPRRFHRREKTQEKSHSGAPRENTAPAASNSARALQLLELPKVLAQLESHCACELGRTRLRAVSPSSNADRVRARLEETSQARAFYEAGKTPPFGGISDVKRLVKNAAVGSVLEATELGAIGKFAAGARRLKETIESASPEEYSVLHSHAARIETQEPLEKAIFDAIDQSSDEIKDSASIRLLKARRSLAQTQQEVQSKLRAMLTDTRVQPHLKDNFVTIREGRYCLPVRAESRNAVPGIVHDRSGSGGAFFIEPQAVVELNNHLRELQLEEREAIREILTALTARVGEVAALLQTSLEACAALDFAFAKGRLSQQHRATVPSLESNGFCLLQARHPLIENCIPNDIRLGDDFDVMMITGPNTGGKTVVLKTLGLLTLMAMCGLHIPAGEKSTLRLPARVWADIGDEQSIEQSLSTFSSHMTNIIGIVENAQKGDLVLFDEIGAGTDPDEGAALAKAILRALQRKGVLVVAITHYGELKHFALGAERFENASVEFDTQSLRPTYHLRIGVPGASNAIAIAQRLGLPDELAARARKYLGRERIEAEAATQRLEETQREMREQTEEAQAAREEVLRLQQDYEKRLQQLQRQQDAQVEAAREEAQRVVREAQAEADAILKELRTAAKESKQTEVARGRLRTLRERTDRQGTEEQGREKLRVVPLSSPLLRSSAPLLEGASVRVKSLNKEGVLLSAPRENGRVEVRVGNLRVEVAAHDVEGIKGAEASTPSLHSAIRLDKALSVPDEINLIGQTTEEALPQLQKYLDDAILADASQVRIVHGRGTGALRNMIHRFLKSYRAVSEFHLAPQNEGGEGATIVSLNEAA